MKKLLAFSIVLICLIAALPAAYASDTAAYDLPELSMTVDVPADWITFTRDINENDPNLTLFGTTAEAMVSDFESKNIYLNAICLEPISEIVITMLTDEGTQDIYDFNRISDAEMQEGAQTIMDEMQEAMGDSATYTGSGIYAHSQAKFAVFNFETGGDTPDHAQQYTTIINGQDINITLHSYAGEITAEQEQLLKNVVDSVTFIKVTEKPGIDLSKAMTTGIIGAIGGGIAAVVGISINKSRRKRAEAKAAAAYTGGAQQPGNPHPPYSNNPQYPGNPRSGAGRDKL